MAPLDEWIRNNVTCVSSQQLNVEASFNILSNICASGKGKRKSSTESRLHNHLQNRCYEQRPAVKSSKTGKIMQWKPTKNNLKQVESSLKDYVASVKDITL